MSGLSCVGPDPHSVEGTPHKNGGDQKENRRKNARCRFVHFDRQFHRALAALLKLQSTPTGPSTVPNEPSNLLISNETSPHSVGSSAPRYGVGVRPRPVLSPSVRDAGAATGAILLGLAAKALAAGHRSAPALVWAASDGESRACALLSVSKNVRQVEGT